MLLMLSTKSGEVISTEVKGAPVNEKESGVRQPLSRAAIGEGLAVRQGKSFGAAIAGIDVHKQMLAVMVADVEVQGKYQFERIR